MIAIPAGEAFTLVGLLRGLASQRAVAPAATLGEQTLNFAELDGQPRLRWIT